MLATKIKTMQNLIYETLESCKSKYYENISKKLCSKAIVPKYYRSLLNTLHLPIFHDKKADLFNSFFATQGSVIENNSVLPSSTNPITDQYLANIEFTKDDVKRIICKLDPNKAHGYDMISCHMLKMSGDAIIEPLFKIFKNWLNYGIFLKKATSKTSKTIVQSVFFQSVARFSNVSCTVTC